ncbi:MAG: hypothetical protein KDJ50_02165 [Alphaproteobacteria bacterium]|nr:hypothetical protein [Alphaproteobacteria bacterium]
MNKSDIKQNLGVCSGLFEQNYQYEAYEMLRQTARLRTENFLRGVRDKTILVEDGYTPHSHSPELDAWVASEEGQETLKELVSELNALVRGAFARLKQRQSQTGLQHQPIGHDLWQIAKDTAEAMRFYDLERPTGYKQTFVIPTSFHDLGRFLEAHFYDKKNPFENWIPHAQLSFLMLDKVLEQQKYFGMPRALKNHFLYAVLAHSYSENGLSYMSRAVQACDRAQLIGPEGLIRASTYIPAYKNGMIGYPQDGSYAASLPKMMELNEAVPVLEYFARCMPPNMGDAHGIWRSRIHDENIELLAIFALNAGSNTVFAPKLVSDIKSGEDRLSTLTREFADATRTMMIIDRSSGQIMEDVSVEYVQDLLLDESQRPSGAALLSAESSNRIRTATESMTAEERKAYAMTLLRAKEQRQEQEEMDLDILKDVYQMDWPEYMQALAEPSLALVEETVSYHTDSNAEAETNALAACAPQPRTLFY